MQRSRDTRHEEAEFTYEELIFFSAEPFLSNSGRVVFLNAHRYQSPLASIFFPESWTAAPPDITRNQSAAVADVNSPRSDMWASNPWQP